MKTEPETRNDPFRLPPPSKGMRAFSAFVFFLVGLAVGAFIFWNPFDLSFLPGGSQEHAREGGAEPADAVDAPQLWTCPMHPEVVEPEPGTCPICHMKLVPLKPPGGASEPGTVKIDPAIVQQIGVQSEAVREGEVRPVIRTVGTVDYDEKALFLVTTKFEGWIEDVYVNYVGQEVKKGQRLFSIYSPELVSTQEEYLAARNYLRELERGGSEDAARSARRLVDASRKRLAYWDITEEQIRTLERSGTAAKTLTVASPATGVVIRKMDAALEGMYVKAGMNLYEIADLSTVWVHADLYESQLARVKPGLEAQITLPAFPGETFSGKVLYLYPYVSEKTRTMRACIEIRNRKGEKVEPGMYADVRFMPVAARRAVLVPEDAVIRTGERNVVFVDLGGGRFLPREVVLGLKGDGVFEVEQGLAPGERVVVSAQFLLDSESRLQDFIRKLTAGPKEANP